jgi:hypothetical protein
MNQAIFRGRGRALVGVAIAIAAAPAVAVAREPIATSTTVPPAGVAEQGAAAADPTAAAVAFAFAHHPELVPLLDRLRKESPGEFAAAVADLDRTRERLAKLRDGQPERHEAALADWKLSSRIRLALARLATNPSAEAEDELRQLVRQRAAARLVPLRAERDRITARLEKVNAQLEAFDRDPETAIAAEYAAVRAKAASRPNLGRKPAAQPSLDPPGKARSPKPEPTSL